MYCMAFQLFGGEGPQGLTTLIQFTWVCVYCIHTLSIWICTLYECIINMHIHRGENVHHVKKPNLDCNKVFLQLEDDVIGRSQSAVINLHVFRTAWHLNTQTNYRKFFFFSSVVFWNFWQCNSVVLLSSDFPHQSQLFPNDNGMLCISEKPWWDLFTMSWLKQILIAC